MSIGEKLSVEHVEGNIRALMFRHDLTIREFASDIGVGYKCIKAIFEGKNKPSIDTLIKISNAFDVPIDKMLRKGGCVKPVQCRLI